MGSVTTEQEVLGFISKRDPMNLGELWLVGSKAYGREKRRREELYTYILTKIFKRTMKKKRNKLRKS